MMIVFGSIYMDVSFPIEGLPARGDIIPAGPVFTSPGGKGANVAVAAARCGARVYMVGKVGNDVYGDRLLAKMRGDGVITTGVGHSAHATGTVCVLAESDGTNTQIASPGANREATHDQIPDEILRPDATVMTGLSLPRDQVETLLRRMRERGIKTVLNLSPIKPYGHELSGLADMIIVNDGELVALVSQLGGPDGMDVADQLTYAVGKTGADVVVTLGGDGVAALRRSGESYRVQGFPIDHLVDTNGAGDCFAGTFIAGLDSGLDWDVAMTRANVAAALSCQRRGAMESYPYQDDIDRSIEAGHPA